MVRKLQVVLEDIGIKAGDKFPGYGLAEDDVALVLEVASDLRQELNDNTWAPQLNEAITQRRKQARWPKLLATPKRILADVFSERSADLANEVAVLRALTMVITVKNADMSRGLREMVRAGIITRAQLNAAIAEGHRKDQQFIEASSPERHRFLKEWREEQEQNCRAA